MKVITNQYSFDSRIVENLQRLSERGLLNYNDEMHALGELINGGLYDNEFNNDLWESMGEFL